MAQRLYQRETQYLGFSPINIVDLGTAISSSAIAIPHLILLHYLVVNSVNDYVVDGAQGVRKYLLENEQSPFRDDEAMVTEVSFSVALPTAIVTLGPDCQRHLGFHSRRR